MNKCMRKVKRLFVYFFAVENRMLNEDKQGKIYKVNAKLDGVQ